jgi:DNA-binding NarL/FixJ family response regulator
VAAIDMVADTATGIDRLREAPADLLLVQADDAGTIAPLLDAARAAGTRAIVLFAPSDAIDADRLRAHGAALALPKPVTPSAIVAAMHELYALPVQAAA